MGKPIKNEWFGGEPVVWGLDAMGCCRVSQGDGPTGMDVGYGPRDTVVSEWDELTECMNAAKEACRLLVEAGDNFGSVSEAPLTDRAEELARKALGK